MSQPQQLRWQRLAGEVPAPPQTQTGHRPHARPAAASAVVAIHGLQDFCNTPIATAPHVSLSGHACTAVRR